MFNKTCRQLQAKLCFVSRWCSGFKATLLKAYVLQKICKYILYKANYMQQSTGYIGKNLYAY